MSAIATNGRRYDSATIAEARKLADASWSAYKIAQIFNRRGIPVSEGTVRCWIDPKYAERRSLGNRQRMREVLAKAKAERAQGGPWFHANASAEYRMQRLVALATVGLTVPKLVEVLRLDFGDVLSEHEVRRAVETGRPPRRWRPTEGHDRTARAA
jgi:hypothetical protein